MELHGLYDQTGKLVIKRLLREYTFLLDNMWTQLHVEQQYKLINIGRVDGLYIQLKV